jgi:hypothetical protein
MPALIRAEDSFLSGGWGTDSFKAPWSQDEFKTNNLHFQVRLAALVPLSCRAGPPGWRKHLRQAGAGGAVESLCHSLNVAFYSLPDLSGEITDTAGA